MSAPFINPERIRKQGQHNQAGAGPTTSVTQNTTTVLPQKYGETKDIKKHNSINTHRNRDTYHNNSHSRYYRGGYYGGGSANISIHSTYRGENAPQFLYDDTHRPRPKNFVSKWDKPPTKEQIEYYARFFQQTAYPPNIQKGISRSALDMNHLRGMIIGGENEKDSIDVTGTCGDTDLNRRTQAQLLGPAMCAAAGIQINDSNDSQSNRLLNLQSTTKIQNPILSSTDNTNNTISSTNNIKQQPIEGPLDSASIPLERQACRVYVGGLDQRTTEEEIRNFFIQTIQKVEDRELPTNEEDIKRENEKGQIYDIQMRGAYAFIEFYRKQDAEVALSMDGIMMKDTQQRIKCPKEVQIHYQQNPPKKYNIPGTVPSNVENGPNKIFLGSIPKDMTDIEIREIVENIGKLSALNLVKDINDGTSKGYAFFTYMEPEITDHAIQVLHGHVVRGGKRLLCARAGTVPAPLPSLNQTIVNTKNDIITTNDIQDTIIDNTTVLNDNDTSSASIPPPPPPPPPPPLSTLKMYNNDNNYLDYTSTLPTRILKQSNMVTEEMLQTEYDDIIQDVRTECGKAGNVHEILGIKDVIYVEYSNIHEAQSAFALQHGRIFGDTNRVCCSYYPEEKFGARIFE